MEDDHKKPRTRRYFSPEFKARTVELIRTSGKSIGEVSRELDLTETAVREWVRQADVDDGKREGLTTDEREEREILKKATAFFAKETR